MRCARILLLLLLLLLHLVGTQPLLNDQGSSNLTTTRAAVEVATTTEQANAPTPSALGQKPPLIAVLLRGQAFREGGQLTVNTTSDPSPQRRAFSYVISRVIEPLERAGRTVELFADAMIAPHDRSEEYKRIVSGAWMGDRAPNGVRVSSRHTKTQLGGFVNSLKWIDEVSPGILRRADHILMTRIDFAFRPDINLPLDHVDNLISILYKMPDTNSARIADGLFWIPRSMVQMFMAKAPTAPKASAHLLHKVVPYQLLYYCMHNSDTARGWNPVYKITGRAARDGGNGGPLTHWNERNVFQWMSVSNQSGFTFPRHRHRFLSNGSALEVVVELEGVRPPPGGFNKTVQAKVLRNEVYFVCYEPRANRTAAAHAVLPVAVETQRQEITWAAPGATFRTAGRPGLSSAVSSLLVVRVPVSRAPNQLRAEETPPDYVPTYRRRESKDNWQVLFERGLAKWGSIAQQQPPAAK
jgi:hypothetical protein